MNELLANEEAEQAVLGSLLIKGDGVAAVAGSLASRELHAPQHRLLYEAMLALFERSDRIDSVTVKNELGERLEEAGGAVYIAELVERAPLAGEVEPWVRIVAEKARRREALRLGQQLAERAHSSGLDTNELLEDHQTQLQRLLEGQGGSVQSLGQVLPESMKALDEFLTSSGGVTGVPTGLVELD